MEEKVIMKFVRLTTFASKPSKMTVGSVGYDLASAYDYRIEPCNRCLCKTDLTISIPVGCYGRVAPRSGLAIDHFIDVGAGGKS
jgi:dUTP pyrophosphatase